MTSQACQQVTDQMGSGIAAALRGVDCVAGEASAMAFGRLFAPGGALGTALTLVLTLFVALFALALLTGRSSVSNRSLTPRMMTLGLVLTFATSWLAYQSVVWNLAVATPDWLAGILTGTQGSATQVFAEKIDVVFIAIEEATAGQADISALSPSGMMWLGAMLFMLGTVGLLVTTKIALGVLVALGPLFVVLALFDGTRGLFTGWIKGLTMCALAPLFAVLGGSVMLELAVPVLGAIVSSAGQVDARAGMAFFMIGAVHVALMIMVLKVAGTMVGGWNVFGLAAPREKDAPVAPVTTPAAVQAGPQLAVAQALNDAGTQARRVEISAVATAAAANDAGGQGNSRTTRIHTGGQGSERSISGSAPSRTTGLGSRFKPAQTTTNSLSMENKR